MRATAFFGTVSAGSGAPAFCLTKAHHSAAPTSASTTRASAPTNMRFGPLRTGWGPAVLSISGVSTLVDMGDGVPSGWVTLARAVGGLSGLWVVNP